MNRAWASVMCTSKPAALPSFDETLIHPFFSSPFFLCFALVCSDELMDEPVKRHSDAIFTDNYSRFRKQMAVKKYLNSVLTGKRRY